MLLPGSLTCLLTYLYTTDCRAALYTCSLRITSIYYLQGIDSVLFDSWAPGLLGFSCYVVPKATSSILELARPMRLACLLAFGSLRLESSPVLAGICGLCRHPLLPWPGIPPPFMHSSTEWGTESTAYSASSGHRLGTSVTRVSPVWGIPFLLI